MSHDEDQSAAPGYEYLDGLLGRAGAQAGASECHGMICGALCAGGRIERELWREHVLTETEPGGTSEDACLRALSALASASRAALDSPDMEFRPLLPGDETALAPRMEALVQWSTGWLFGFGVVVHEEHEDELTGECREFLGDVREFTRLDTAAAPGGEDDEADYAELVEYLKAGALLVREEFRRRDPEFPFTESVH